MTVSLDLYVEVHLPMLTIVARVEDPIGRSMPDLNATGRASHLLPSPEESVTLKHYEIEEPSV